jgi:hypothetical protein
MRSAIFDVRIQLIVVVRSVRWSDVDADIRLFCDLPA